MNNSGSGDSTGTTYNGSAPRTISYNTIGAPSTTGANASGTWSIAINGNAATATNLSNSWTNWNSVGGIGSVVGMLAWKNYGNNHVIFDASQSTSPSGTSVNNTNQQNNWSATYPTLMGWNGSGTYGVRVDSARISDNTSGNSATTSQRTFDYIYATSYLESAGAVYGTVFYDNNDRSYYLDPNGGSVLNGTVVIKGNDNQLAIDGTVGGLASGLFFRESGVNKWELYNYSGQFRFYNYMEEFIIWQHQERLSG
jgi:hypothetical protein